MRRYAEHRHCRRSFLLTYFGQNYPGPCGRCDNDDPARPPAPTAAEPFAVGTRVLSERWGEGTVQRYDGDQLTVLFDEHGYRNLLLPLVLPTTTTAHRLTLSRDPVVVLELRTAHA